MSASAPGSVLTMQGAEPFFYPGNEIGCLLIHGYTGTPYEMRMLGESLHQAGFTVLAPRLFGHATQPADMIRSRSWDWMASVEDGLNLLKGCTRQQVVMGLSMGGILALMAAARFPVDGVVSLSTPYTLFSPQQLLLARLLHPIVRYVPKGAPDWHDPDSACNHREYRSYPTRSLLELDALLKLMKSELHNVITPALIVQSHQDRAIPPQSMDYLYDHIGSPDKIRLWVENSGHVIICEPDREQIFQEIQNFIHLKLVKV